MSRDPRVAALRHAALAGLLGLALAALLVWPSPYRYERRVFASVPPEAWGARPLAAFWVVDGRARPGEIPVQFNLRRHRLTGRESVEVWPGRRGGRRWFEAAGFAASRDRLWAVGARGRRAFRLSVPHPWREAVEGGRIGALRPRLGAAEWRPLPAGRAVPDPASGRPRSYREAMVALGAGLVLEREAPGVAPVLFLCGRDGRLLARLSIEEEEGGALRVTSSWLPRADLARRAPLSVVEPVLGWRLPLEAPSLRGHG